MNNNIYLTSLKFPFIESYSIFDSKSLSWQDIHDEVVQQEHINSNLDDIKLTRNKLWSDLTDESLSPIKSLENISDLFLKFNAGDICLKDEIFFAADVHYAWSYLLKGIEPNTILAWKWRKRDAKRCPATITVNNPPLERLFKSGLNDYHIHLGAVGSLKNLLRIIPPNDSVKDIIVEQEKLNENNWIRGAGNGNNFINPHLVSLTHGILAWIVHLFHVYDDDKPSKPPVQYESIAKAMSYWGKIEKLLKINIKNHSEINISHLQSKIISILDLITDRRYKNETVFTDNEFLSKSFKIYSELETSEEMKKTFDVYKYYLDKMLWLRNYLYTFFTHQPNCNGLAHFKKYFDRVVFTGSEELQFTERIETLSPSQNYNINNLELRLGIQNFNKHLPIILKEYSSWQGWSIEKSEDDRSQKLSFILSLSKIGVNDDKVFSNGVRYSELINMYLSQIDDFFNIIKTEPDLLFLVRGFDVCSLEKNLPNWIFVLLYKHIEHESEKLLYNERELAPQIKFTFHAGEDFYTPMDGLRNVYEVINWGTLNDYNRIGHGCVLGLDIRQWFEAREGMPIQLPAGVLLDNLILEWHFLFKKLIPGDIKIVEENIDQVIEFIRKQIKDRYDLEIFKSHKTKHLWNAYKSRFDYEKLKDSNKPSVNHLNLLKRGEWFRLDDCQNIKSLGIDEKLFSEYLCVEELFVAEQEVFILNDFLNDNLIERYENIQKYIVGLLNNISVETCPSSNILVEGHLDFKKHHIFSLHPPDDQKKVNLSINTDDPMVCNTNIFNEYLNIFLAAKKKVNSVKVKDSDIIEWLYEINSKSMEYSFHVEGCNKKIYKLCKEKGIFYKD